MTRAEIEDRIAELEAENAKAKGWGAAVGARSEEIISLKRALAALQEKSYDQ